MPNRVFAMLAYTVIMALSAGLDQYSKALAIQNLESYEPFYITSFLNFTLAYNRGAAFGFLDQEGGWQVVFFTAIALLVLVYLTTHLWREAYRDWLHISGYGFIAGGAIGNVIDRINHGFVIDFIDVHFAGWHFWIFNLADCALSLGVGLLLLSMLLMHRSQGNSERVSG